MDRGVGEPLVPRSTFPWLHDRVICSSARASHWFGGLAIGSSSCSGVTMAPHDPEKLRTRRRLLLLTLLGVCVLLGVAGSLASAPDK